MNDRQRWHKSILSVRETKMAKKLNTDKLIAYVIASLKCHLIQPVRNVTLRDVKREGG